MLFNKGGDDGAGLAIELRLLALLELFLLFPRLKRALWKFMKLAAAGEKGFAISIPELAVVPVTKGLPIPRPTCLIECGVM